MIVTTLNTVRDVVRTFLITDLLLGGRTGAGAM